MRSRPMDLEPAWAGPARGRPRAGVASLGRAAQGAHGFLDARVQHPCPFCEFSGNHLDVAMAQWCNRHSEGLQISVWSR